MGVIPLCFKSAVGAESVGLTGHEQYKIHLPSSVLEMQPGQDIVVTTSTGKSFMCTLHFDTEVNATFTYYTPSCFLKVVLDIDTISKTQL